MKTRLELLRNKLNQLNYQNMEIDQEEKREIEIIKNEIAKKHLKLKEPINKKMEVTRKELKACINQFELFSTFDSKMIGNILEKLVSVFEGEEYSYQETTYKTIKHYDPVFNRVEDEIDKKIKIIIKNDCKSNSYDYKSSPIHQFVADGKAIILSEKEYELDSQLTFYNSNRRRDNVENVIRYGKFNYVKEFMDEVINFRINNNINDQNEIDFKNLSSNFFLKNKDLIQNNHQLRLEEKQKKINDDDFFQRVHQVILNWPEWKQEEYNNNFAISPYAKKINIKRKETKK